MSIFNNKVNYIYSLGYVLFTAFSMTFIQSVSVSYSPLLSLLLTSVFATLFFHVINLKGLRSIYQVCWKYWKETLLLCLNSLVMWVVTFYGSAILGSFGFIFLTFITAAIIGFVVMYRKHFQFASISFISTLGLIFVLVLGVTELKTQKLIPNYHGVWLGLLGGLISYLNRKQIHAFSRKTDFSASSVLAVRFYGIIMALGASTVSAWYQLSWHLIIVCLLLALVTFVIPMYFNQRAIVGLGAEKHSIICAICPAVTCLTESVYRRAWSSKILLISLITAILLALPTVYKLKIVRKPRSL